MSFVGSVGVVALSIVKLADNDQVSIGLSQTNVGVHSERSNLGYGFWQPTKCFEGCLVLFAGRTYSPLQQDYVSNHAR